MSNPKLLPILKATGVSQREDTALSLPIALALRERVLKGLSAYPAKGKKLSLAITTPTGESVMQIGHNTLSTWIVRGNVIPETGKALRAYLDEAREEYREEKSRAEQEKIAEEAQKALAEIVQMPTTGGRVITRKYKPVETIQHEGREEVATTITEFEGANPRLVEAKVKALTFGLEQLRPERYGSKVEMNHKHFVFDLAKLREAKRLRDQQRQAQ